MNSLFIYYKLPADQHACTKQRLRDMMEKLMHQIPLLQVDLMQRPETSTDGLETWMEIYRHPSGVSPETMKTIEGMARDADLPQPRRVEVFVTLT